MHCRLLLALVVTAGNAMAQVPADPLATLTPAQRTEFNAAGKTFRAEHYAEALIGFRHLLVEVPGNVVLEKFASEAALNTGDTQFAIETLKPVAAADPMDWQAHAMLARAYAQNVSAKPADSDAAKFRDEELETLYRLHDTGSNPQFANMRDFLLETDHQGERTIKFFPALTPWGPYKVHLIARIYDATNQQVLRITLESSDVDQTTFAKQHPTEAASGQRGFSLDGYGQDSANEAGQTVQTHYTYGFFIGQPTYDELRTRILAIAAGTAKPLSSRVGTVTR